MDSWTVLHLNDRLSQRGGADIHLLGLLRAQQAAGRRVYLAVGREDGSASPVVPTRRVRGLDARTDTACSIQPLLQEIQPNLVHIHNVMNPRVLEEAAEWPTLMTVQDHRVFCPGRGKLTAAGRVCTTPMSRAVCAHCFGDTGYFEHIYALTRRRLDALSRLTVVVLSEYMKQELSAVGIPAGRIHVVPPFAWGLGPAAREDHPPCVLFCGRLVEAKGVEDAVAAWRLSGLDLPLVVIGAGPLRARLETMGPRVQCKGWVPHEDIGAWYRASRVVVMPSRWQEPFGITGLEALTLGTPVAAWTSGGIAEWYRGPPLPAWGDVPALARRLRTQAGATAGPGPGFDRQTLMGRLDGVYARVMGRET